VSGHNRRLVFVSVSVALLSLALVSLKASTTSAQQETWLPPMSTGVSPLSSVSCTSPTFCAAVGNATATTYDGTSWSAPVTLPNGGAEAVSCASASFCVTVGAQGTAVTYNGVSWSAPVDIDGNADLTTVSCPTVSFCLAAGTTFGVVNTPSAVTYNGTSWSAPIAAPPGRGLSCASTSFCVIADLGDGAWAYDGDTSSEIPIAGTIASPTYEPQSVSCATATFCVAGLDSGIASIYNGTSWSPSDIDGTIRIDSVSCPSVNFCVAFDDKGDALTYNGTSWSDPAHVSGVATFPSVSCPSVTFCVVADGGGNVAIYSTLSTTVLLPSDGATVSAGQYLDATASSGVTSVEYELTGGSLNDAVIATANPTYYGWLAEWDTTSVPNGTYTLQSVASIPDGVTSTSPGVSVTVNN
jgi:Bacterial Ig domain